MSDSGMEQVDRALAESRGVAHEQKRLEATAVVAHKVSELAVKREKLRTLFREAILCLLIIVVALLAYRTATESSRTRAAVEHAAQINCKQYALIGSLPVGQSPATSALGLSLIADFRNSYYAYDCQQKYGQLRKPDPKLLQLLDPAAKQGVGDPIPETTTP